MLDNIQLPLLISGGMLVMIAAPLWLNNHYTLNNIKSRTVGDGQHGTARWATEKEIRKAKDWNDDLCAQRGKMPMA